MAERRCSIDRCDELVVARGWCSTHYKRWLRHGSAEAQRPTAEARFWARVEKTASCWLWTGRLDEGGYARMRVDGRRVLVHRFAYELLVGPIPDGLHIDHVWANGCRHRHCVNPAHLEPVTPAENIARSEPARRDRCVNGHEFTEENTHRDSRGWRSCRTCRSAAHERAAA